MDYKARAKSRILKRKIGKILGLIKFNSLNATSYHKVIILGALIVISGLFFTWVEMSGVNGIGKLNGFSVFLGVSGRTILTLNIFIIYVLLSHSSKESLKKALNISFKDYHPPIIGGAIMILMIINSIVSMNSLWKISSEIHFGKGVFIDISGTIILIVGGLYLKKYYENNIKGIYSDTGEQMEILSEKAKDNMKLPF